jgi:Cu/Ag efflux protein CusF
MSRTTTAIFAIAVMLSAAIADAQVKVIPGARQTSVATVEAIDMTSRRITLRTKDGDLRTVQVPQQATRLAEIKPGDTVTATYYENIVIRVKPPGEPDKDTQQEGLTPGTGPRPVGTSGSQRTMTATISAINMSEPSITFSGPRNWSYHARVMDKNALSQVKVGDRVDFVWTEATLVSVAK